MKSKRTPAEVAADAKRTGRPPVGPQSRLVLLNFKVTRGELAAMKRRAKHEKTTVSEMLRRLALGAPKGGKP